MSDYIVTKNIDYLSFTSVYAQSPFGERAYQIIKPVIANYDNAEVHKSGTIHMWHSRNAKLGHHYICSGKTLEWFRAHNHTDIEVVSSAMKHGKISRIDIAITSQRVDEGMHEFTPSAIAVWCNLDMLKSRLKPNNGLVKNGLVETQYIGNPSNRKRIFRAYDKGIEQGFLENLLIRYELETRKGANVVARQVVSRNDLGGIIKRYVDFPDCEIWNQIMDSAPSKVKHETGEIVLDHDELQRLERAAKWLWLQDSIAPLIKKLITEQSRYDEISQFENEGLAEFKRLAGIS